jgi:hypothetical protein
VEYTGCGQPERGTITSAFGAQLCIWIDGQKEPATKAVKKVAKKPVTKAVKATTRPAFVAAVSLTDEGHPLRVKLSPVPGFKLKAQSHRRLGQKMLGRWQHRLF